MRRLTEQQWIDIRTRYEMGDAIRAIARDFDIPHGTIQHRVKKENWTQNLATQISDIKNKITEISHVANPEQLPAIEERLNREISESMEILKSINNVHKGALNLHNIILKKTIDDTKVGKMGVKEASQILANTGLKVEQIHKAHAPQLPSVEINNNQQNNTQVVFELNPVSKK